MEIKILNDNILNTTADAIVNAANNNLLAGGGVCGAIFEKAGREELQKECNKIRFCKTGDAVITSGHSLKSKYIIHAVGPIYGVDKNAEKLLQSAYLACLNLAEKNGIESIAFPCISTGIYGFPIDKATPIALKTIINFPAKKLKSCYLYCYKEEEFLMYLKTYALLKGTEK